VNEYRVKPITLFSNIDTPSKNLDASDLARRSRTRIDVSRDGLFSKEVIVSNYPGRLDRKIKILCETGLNQSPLSMFPATG
jgi:hypothetical protein